MNHPITDNGVFDFEQEGAHHYDVFTGFEKKADK
jgi:hypothetical protein